MIAVKLTISGRNIRTAGTRGRKTADYIGITGGNGRDFMNRKKLLYLSMVLAVLLLLVGCGNAEPAAPDNAPEVLETSEDTAQTPETATVPEETPNHLE